MIKAKTYFSNILQIFCKPENNFINRIAGTYNNLQELAAKAKKAGALHFNSKHRNIDKKKWYTHRDLNPKPSGP